ncbi:MAG: hypothetical protein AAFQ94_16290 [Bacteroidota bacterium]
MIHLLMTGFLTVLTQVGGIIYLISIVLFRKFSLLKKTLAGILLYLICVFLIVPFFAKFGNREPLPLTGKIAPYTVFTCLQNRHYVSTKTKTTLESVSKKFSLQYPESRIFYLDANFPFFDGFPLFPHLSHSDGKKLDLAFYYKNDNVPVNKSASFIGYGFYEGPIGKEINYAAICRRKGFWQYGFIGKLIPMRNQELYSVDETRTRRLIQLLNNASGTDKIFLEPHLQTRWKLHALRKIRFHGCHAVRHDDHIHWQIH